jgi:DNA-binding response OmpR family regulator
MNVLLVEPDDDFCLFLRQAVASAGCRATITGSFSEAKEAMTAPESVDLLITNASLPDGSGLLLALDAARIGKQVIVLRQKQDRIVVSDREGTLYRGDCVAVGRFLTQMLDQARLRQDVPARHGRELA